MPQVEAAAPAVTAEKCREVATLVERPAFSWALFSRHFSA
jgi:hypothetical protein